LCRVLIPLFFDSGPDPQCGREGEGGGGGPGPTPADIRHRLNAEKLTPLALAAAMGHREMFRPGPPRWGNTPGFFSLQNPKTRVKFVSHVGFGRNRVETILNCLRAKAR